VAGLVCLGLLGRAPSAGAVPPAAGVDAGDGARTEPPRSEVVERLLALQLASGGWTFWSPPGRRPQPLTLVMRAAERSGDALGVADWELVVVRSPGTPQAGLVLLDAYDASGDERYLRAARRAGDLLVALQLASGGWASEMPARAAAPVWWFRWLAWRTQLDDDVTSGPVRFLLALWQRTGEARYRSAAERAIALLVRAQLPSGAWPHDWRVPLLRRLRPGHERRPSLNDGATSLVITTLVDAAQVLARPALLAAAVRGADWLARVQGPPPNGGWAQQYDEHDRPAGARRFEPAALASLETRLALDALAAVAVATGDARWCAAIDAGVEWLRRVAVAPGCWARLHSLDGGEPLYLAADGRRVALADAKVMYDWAADFGIPATLVRLGRPPLGASPARLAGDPGPCPPLGILAPRRLDDARDLIAIAGSLPLDAVAVRPLPCPAPLPLSAPTALR